MSNEENTCKFLYSTFLLGTVNSINVNILNQIEERKKILETKGGEKIYDEEIRKKFTPKFLDIDYKSHKSITFEN